MSAAQRIAVARWTRAANEAHERESETPSPASGVMRRASPFEVMTTAWEDAPGRALCEERRARAHAVVVQAITAARGVLGVEAWFDEDAPWPRLAPFFYRGAVISSYTAGRRTGPTFVFAGASPPRGTVHANELARELGWGGARGTPADYRKLYVYARAGLLLAFAAEVSRVRFYLVVDGARLRAADAVRRLGGRLSGAPFSSSILDVHKEPLR